MNKLYTDDGYVNIPWMISLGIPYLFIVGGRGTGKTITTLKTLLIDEDYKAPFILMRRTQQQADLISNPHFSPIITINRIFDKSFILDKISKNNSGIYESEIVDGKKKAKGDALAYTVGLSTISSIRGFDTSNIEYLVFDEFIPETHERLIKNEGLAFKNAYETINRNRELEGRKALTSICLANANNLSNPLFAQFDLVERAYDMIKRGVEEYINRDKGIALFMLQNSPISKQKKNTALYKVNEDSEFENMAIKNIFDVNDSHIKSRPIKEYRLLVVVGSLGIYEHKTRNEYYISSHISGDSYRYGLDDISLRRFRDNYRFLLHAYLNEQIIFEKMSNEILFKRFFALD